jgi:hypothetical protein
MFQEIFYTSGLITVVIALIILPIYFRTKRKLSLHPSAGPQAMSTPRIINMSGVESAQRILPVIQDIRPSQSFDTESDYDFTLEIEGLPSDEDLIDWIPDAESVLMKEAEETVDKIQTVLDNIASYPPDPKEVTSKIKSVLSSQILFLDTEYYHAINHFILVAVKRDTRIELTEMEIASLWKE